MLTPFVLCLREDGGIDSSVSSSFFVFHEMSIVPGFKPAVGWLHEALMNNADARGKEVRELSSFFRHPRGESSPEGVKGSRRGGTGRSKMSGQVVLAVGGLDMFSGFRANPAAE